MKLYELSKLRNLFGHYLMLVGGVVALSVHLFRQFLHV